MLKILILTDSNANPRGSPVVDTIKLNETYPYILREEFKSAVFYQLSYGNITTEELLNQGIGYLLSWEPDVIIVHSGICDCRPEAFSEFQKTLIKRFSGFFFRYLKRLINHPGFIKRRQVDRVSKRSFRKTLRKLKLIFKDSRILWMEISTSLNYEKVRPGTSKRVDEYNKIIDEIYGEDVVKLHSDIVKVNGYCSDNLHINTRGHRIVAEELMSRIGKITRNI